MCGEVASPISRSRFPWIVYGSFRRYPVNMDSQRQYRAYLLRLWRDGPQQRWHATLEEPQTGARHSFATREELFDFLARQTDDVTAPGGAGGTEDGGLGTG